MNTYICNKVDTENNNRDLFWTKASYAEINYYPWKNEQRPYSPITRVRLLHSKNKVFVRFDVEEENIRATYTKANDPICRDSCVEFFFMPSDKDNRYLSFEINPFGALLIGLGTKGNDIIYLNDDRDIFNIKCTCGKDSWRVEYEIPFEFIKRYYKEISLTWQGNFMKCADSSKSPHHGCWNLIKTNIPMFHVPQFFGKIILKTESQ